MKYEDKLTRDELAEIQKWVQWKKDTIEMPFHQYLKKYESVWVPPHVENIHENSASIESFELRMKRFYATGSWSGAKELMN